MAIFGKKEKPEDKWQISQIFDWYDDLIIVFREKGSEFELLYTNIQPDDSWQFLLTPNAVKRGLFKRFPTLVETFPDDSYSPDSSPISLSLDDASGKKFSSQIKSINWTDGKAAIMISLRDVTASLSTEERLYKLAYIDELTNIPNRRKFTEDFSALADRAAAGELVGMVAMFDLDNFKAINDTYGHNTGDLMLKRLTAHVLENDELKDKLYRLGGDEFVIMMSSPSETFENQAAMTEHYSEFASRLLRTYTIPNIDLSCTLSIGVAFFPWHGDTTSELLRKSDIALYKSKEDGRNRITIFEDKYDKARKFEDLYINIQPILTADGKSFGYELVDKGNDSEENVVNLTDINRTLDALGLEDIDNNTRYFINYTDQLLSPGVYNNLPDDKFIIQLHISGGLTRADIERIVKLRGCNYSIALVGISSSSITAEILENADFCRFSKSDKNYMMQKRIILANPNVNFIASDVNTLDEFDRAKKAGYKLFRGYYFNQPVVTRKTKDLSPISANYYRLLQLTSTDSSVNFKEISNIISSDVSLSYKLLRLLNSAAVGLRNVGSISMAVAYLGEESLKKWIGLLALRGIADDKPLELVRLSLIRARFGELLAPHLRNKRVSKHIFLLGMLSLLNVAMEVTKEELLEEIPVADEIRESLLTKTGPYSNIVQFYEHYEYANWDAVSQFADEQGLTNDVINDSYMGAVKWYNDLIETS